MLDTLTERDRLLVAAQATGWVAMAALVAIALWLGARIFWRIVDPPQAPQLTTESTTSSARGSNQPGVDLAALHLFGQSGVAAVPQTFDAPETSLDLILVGTLASEQADSGMAIVADSEGDGFYQVGDDLPGDAKLHEVHTDRIVLVHQGRYETLRLREEKANDGQPRAAAC